MAGGQDGDASEKTEAPTPRRLEKAREEGQVPLSVEAVGFATLLSGVLAFLLILPPLGLDLLHSMRTLLAAPSPAAGAEMLRAAVLVVAPVLAAVMMAAVLSTLGQTGWPERGPRVEFGRINPWAGLRRLLGMEALGALTKTLLKLAAVAGALFLVAEPAMVARTLALSPAGLLQQALSGGRELLVAMLLAFGVLAIADLVWTRLRFLRRLRMSREDVREEMRESEGDPMLKARRRRIAETRARRRMLAEVPKATVVITNPTHYAVALAYRQGEASAPRLVAKGVDAMAARIRAAAEENGVPVVANPPLARALWRLEPDTEIPPEHWQAVAEILAYVWRLQGRAGSG